jgi:glycosyltransferase involved in cell wall biosynthesis
MPVSDQTDGRVTALVVNYKTPDLTRRSVESLLGHYPSLAVLLIDNGSGDDSTAVVRELGSEHANVQVQLNERNVHHGPGMDQGIRLASTPYVFTLDSDTETLKGGFLEEMLEHFADPLVYAVGELRYKNRFGYTHAYWSAEPQATWIPYTHPHAMLLDRAKYLTLAPFIHHGAPCIRNMSAARDAGYVVHHFPISEFIRHDAGGTVMTHGFGVRGRIRHTAGQCLNWLYGRVTGDRTLPVRYPTREQAGERVDEQ